MIALAYRSEKWSAPALRGRVVEGRPLAKALGMKPIALGDAGIFSFGGIYPARCREKC